MRVDIYIGGTKVDLFADENIDVVSSVADIEDITKNTTDYTKTFTCPASKENNKLFKHWYNADVDNSFDARVKIDGEIKLWPRGPPSTPSSHRIRLSAPAPLVRRHGSGCPVPPRRATPERGRGI